MSLDRDTRIKSLQGVRTLAFLGIFSSHAGLTELGAWGVSVFFVLSGFLMAYVYFERELLPGVKQSLLFSFKRLKKLYPLHILMLVAALPFEFVSLAKNFSLHALVLLVGKSGLNITLLQDWVPLQAVYYSLNAVAWYLSACLLLYAAFPGILRGLRSLCAKSEKRGNVSYMFLIAGCVYALQVVLAYAVLHNPALYAVGGDFGKWLTYICPLYRLGDFTIGCCFGVLFRKLASELKRSVATVLEIAAILFAAAAHYLFLSAHVETPLTARNWYVMDVLYLPSSLLLVWVFARSRGWISAFLSTRGMVFLGDLSPYMFLIHQIVIRYLRIVWERLIGKDLNSVVCSAISIIVTVILAICWKHFSSRKPLARTGAS